MKYIDAERLNAEIERLYNGEAPKHDQQCDFDDGYFVGIDAISQLIDSLQQGPPEVDLEKEIKDTCRGYRINDYHEQELGKHDIENIARHFFNLGLNARKEENK